MTISKLALLLTGSETPITYTKERAVCLLCTGGPEKEKAAQTWRSVAAFGSASHKNEYTSKGDNLQSLILASVGGDDHV